MAETISLAHVEKYPLLECRAEGCGMSFVLFYGDKGTTDDGEPFQHIMPQAKFEFCPYCGTQNQHSAKADGGS